MQMRFEFQTLGYPSQRSVPRSLRQRSILSQANQTPWSPFNLLDSRRKSFLIYRQRSLEVLPMNSVRFLSPALRCLNRKLPLNGLPKSAQTMQWRRFT